MRIRYEMREGISKEMESKGWKATNDVSFSNGTIVADDIMESNVGFLNGKPVIIDSKAFYKDELNKVSNKEFKR